MLPAQGSTYLFVQTRDLEIVKRVKRGEWDADDIRRVLRGDQTVGFASYVSLNSEWLGTASRVMSPRHTAFAHLINSIFDKLQIPYDFILRSFHTQLPEDEVSSLDRVGRVSVEINHSSPAFPRVWSALTGGDGTELNDIAAMRIEVIPLRKRTADLKPNLQELVDSLPRDGLESLEARAKAEALDRMSDMYIYGAGALGSFIDVDAESQIPDAMASAARESAELREAIQEFRDEPDLESGTNASGLGISWSSAYGRYVDHPRRKYGQGLLCSMLPKADGFARVAAGFSFSMMGFMAAVMALFSVLGQSRALKKYANLDSSPSCFCDWDYDLSWRCRLWLHCVCSLIRLRLRSSCALRSHWQADSAWC